MREQFRVDLRGLVDILSHHLYRSERVYLRELVQNAARRHHGPRRSSATRRRRGAIEIVPARGYEQLVRPRQRHRAHRDDMRALLSIIGSTSKRADVAAVRRHFLGQFGIGLLSCFLVADSIEVVSRSARTPDAPTRALGRRERRDLHHRARAEAASPSRAPRSACAPARLLPLVRHRRVHAVRERVRRAAGRARPRRRHDVSQQPPPWTLSTEEQLAWCQERFGFEAMGIIPFDTRRRASSAWRSCCPTPRGPGYRTGDRIYSKGMLVADTDDLVIPRWAFFCRAVVDAGDLPLTASREGLQESGELQFVRKRIGFRLLSELIIVQGKHPDVYADIVRLHADGLKALAVQEPDVRDLLIATLPFETTLGERTIQQLLDGTGPVPFVRDADTYAALADVAAHAGVLVVNAGGLHEADLLGVANDGTTRGTSARSTAADVVELARPRSAPGRPGAPPRWRRRPARRSRKRASSCEVASFEPADRPVLWWPTTPGHARMVLNAANSAVKRLLAAPPEADLSAVLRALYVSGPARRTRDAHPRPGRDARHLGAGHGRRPAVRRRVVRPARPAAPRAPRDRRAAGAAAASSPCPGTPA